MRSAAGTSLSGTPYGRGQITDADINAIRSAAQGFGFDPGELNPPSEDKTEIEEYALKIDWNINEHHRAALRYNKMEQSTMRFVGITPSAVSLSGYWFPRPSTYETWMGEVFSDWDENFSTEFKISHKDYAANREPANNWPYIQIGGFPGNTSVNLGTERNTHVNIVESKELNLFAAASWYVGDHTVKFGADHQDNDLMNYYGRDLNGVYGFNSLANFIAGKPDRYSVRAPRPGGSYDDIPAAFTLKNTGVFLQDTWGVNYNLNLMFGVRMDIPDYSRQPLHNQNVQDTYGYDNTYVPDDRLIQPRLGFNYTFDSERPMQLRGGVGLFGGAAPNVWLAGAYQNTGLNYVQYTCNNEFAPDFSPSPEPNIPANCTLSGGARQNVDIIEPGFKLPSVWKTNLAFDHELPWYGIVVSAEALFTSVKNGIYVRRLDVYSDGQGNGATAIGQDGRPLFWNPAGLDPANRGNNGIDPGVNGARTKANRPDWADDVMLISNTDKGSSHQITLGLDKPLQDTWGWSLFYTYTQAKEVSPMTSGQNTSNWRTATIGTVNENIAYHSRYAVRDRVIGQLHWQKAFFGDYKTRASVFYEGRSGAPYSYVFYNDANGDATNTNGPGYFNDLFYVPNGPGDVLWTGGEAMEQAFFDWLGGTELERYRGGIAPTNAFRTGWRNTFDVRISQELPGIFKGHKTELALDIMNIGNLINKNWGLIEDYGFDNVSRVAHYAGIDPATGKYVYHFNNDVTGPEIQERDGDGSNTAVSRWSMMLSIKYRF